MNNIDKAVEEMGEFMSNEETNEYVSNIVPSPVEPPTNGLKVEDLNKIDAVLENNLLTKEASKFYTDPDLKEVRTNLLVTMAQQTEDTDNVNHPQHYTGSIECIDAMLQQFGKEQVKSFCLLNAFKYLFRCNKKHNTPIEDVKKAIWYLNKYIEITNNI